MQRKNWHQVSGQLRNIPVIMNKLLLYIAYMMTSSTGNIFRVTGPLCNSPGEFPAQRPVTQSFDVFFDLRLDIRLSKQSWGWWFQTPSRLSWRHCNVILGIWGATYVGISSNIIAPWYYISNWSALIVHKPTGTWRNDIVIITSKRRRNVVLA